MKKFVVYSLLISLLSVIVGYFYIFELWFPFSFLGHEMGSERETVRFWGIVSIVVGISFMISEMLWLKNRSVVADKFMVILLGVIFLIQIPPVMLWFFNGDSRGFFPHLILIIVVWLVMPNLRKVRNEIE